MAVSSVAAAQTITLGPGNSGIVGFSASISGTTITLNETWNGSGPGSILFSGFTGSNYTIVKNITNLSGNGWSSFANELLPAGSPVNGQPAFIPPGFRPSPNTDGLSFDQGGGIPRSSSFFATQFADELGGRDYLDFSNGIWANNGVGVMTFGLDSLSSGGDFLLFQRPNELTSVVPVPAALPLLLSGLGIFGYLARRRNKA
jgi:hypothetical protein